jgi:hypothetical protein
LLLPLFPELLLPGSLLFKMLTCRIGENEKECGQLFPLEMQTQMSDKFRAKFCANPPSTVENSQ